MNRDWRSVLLAVIGLLVAFSFASNPYADFAATDSAVFHYIGRMMHQGVIPYRDVFDHKGPLIYFINWIATFGTSAMWGVWIIEILAFGLTFLLIQKFANHYFRDVPFVPFTAIYGALFTYGNMAGNFTETYAHFFIVPVLLWVFSSAKDNTSFTPLQSFVSGLCFAAILLLRPNMGVFAFVTAIFFLHDLLERRDFKIFLRNSLLVLVGMAALLLPVILYFHLHNALSELWNCYITYNLAYASNSFAGINSNLIFAGVILGIGVLPLFDCEWRRATLYNLIFGGLTFLVLFANSTYKHYLLMIVPGAILPIAWGCEKLKAKKIGSAVLGMIVCVSLGSVLKEVLQSNLDVSGCVKHVLKTKGISGISEYKEGSQYREMTAIAEYIDHKKCVAVIGNDCEVYRRLGASSKSYYIYLPEAYDEELKKRIIEEIASGKNDYAISNRVHLHEEYHEVLASLYSKVITYGDYTLWKYCR